MHNIVSLGSDRPRPQRALGVPRSGARILFFTGVRYCRDDERASSPTGSDHPGDPQTRSSERMLDAAAH